VQHLLGVMPNPIALQFWVAAVAPPIAVGVSRFTLPSATWI